MPGLEESTLLSLVAISQGGDKAAILGKLYSQKTTRPLPTHDMVTPTLRLEAGSPDGGGLFKLVVR